MPHTAENMQKEAKRQLGCIWRILSRFSACPNLHAVEVSCRTHPSPHCTAARTQHTMRTRSVANPVPAVPATSMPGPAIAQRSFALAALVLLLTRVHLCCWLFVSSSSCCAACDVSRPSERSASPRARERNTLVATKSTCRAHLQLGRRRGRTEARRGSNTSCRYDSESSRHAP